MSKIEIDTDKIALKLKEIIMAIPSIDFFVFLLKESGILTNEIEKENIKMNVKIIHNNLKAKRYDCTKTLDYSHERERMCSSFVNAEDGCSKCPLFQFYTCTITTEKCISIVQNWSDTHPEIEYKERPVLTSNDASVLEALQVMGYHWIAKDKVTSTDRFDTYAFVNKPEWDKDRGWWIINDKRELKDIKNPTYPIAYDFSFLSYKDTEATSIDWLLRGDE